MCSFFKKVRDATEHEASSANSEAPPSLTTGTPEGMLKAGPRVRGLPPLTQRVLPHQRRDVDAHPPPDSTQVRGERCGQGKEQSEPGGKPPAPERAEETPARRGA